MRDWPKDEVRPQPGDKVVLLTPPGAWTNLIAEVISIHNLLSDLYLRPLTERPDGESLPFYWPVNGVQRYVEPPTSDRTALEEWLES